MPSNGNGWKTAVTARWHAALEPFTLSDMNSIQLLSAILFPLAMAIGGVAAWRASKKEHTVEAEKTTWRDTSLDDWRKERDQAAEQDRSIRAEQPEILTGSSEEQAIEKKHQRIGG